jgi:hypothetical protein
MSGCTKKACIQVHFVPQIKLKSTVVVCFLLPRISFIVPFFFREMAQFRGVGAAGSGGVGGEGVGGGGTVSRSGGGELPVDDHALDRLIAMGFSRGFFFHFFYLKKILWASFRVTIFFFDHSKNIAITNTHHTHTQTHTNTYTHTHAHTHTPNAS